MPVSIRQENEGRIVVWVFEGSWTWEEYYEKRTAVNEAIEATPHPVDMIIDMSNSQLLPKNLMTHAGSAARNAPDNLRKTVFVGSNMILRTFFKMFSQLYGVLKSGKELDFMMVASLDEAYAALRKGDV